MIAAVGRWTRNFDRRLDRLFGRCSAAAAVLTVRADRRLDRLIDRARPAVLRRAGRVRAAASKRRRAAKPVLLRWRRRVGGPLRAAAALALRAAATAEKTARRAATFLARTVKRIRHALPAKRVALLLIAGSALALVVSQFLEYRAIEIGQPGYAGLPAARPPTVGSETAGEAHSYMLVPLGLLAGGLALAAIRRPRPRRFGLLVAGLGLIGLATALLVDLPAGLDEGAAAAEFSGANATLRGGFSVELAACVGMVLGGLLYYHPPCQTRINLSGRVASALRRRSRRRASSRARARRSGSPPRSGVVSAPASRP